MHRICTFLLALLLSRQSAAQPDPRTLIEKAMEHWRGGSSYAEMTMVIHRPD